NSGTPTRRSLAPQRMKPVPGVPSSAVDGSLFWKDDLQSTLLDGHRIVRPELDLSVINGRDRPIWFFPEDAMEMMEFQTLMYTYLTLKMQKNLSRLEEKAERNLLLVNDEKDHLQEKVYKLKRENLLLDREEKLHDMLDKQAEALAPSIEVEETFKNNYKTFATALDCTRHQLPIKDIHVMGTRQRYLEDLQKQLETTKSLLKDIVPTYAAENEEMLSTIKELEENVFKTNAEISRTFNQVLDLSFKVNKEIALQNQKAVEESRELDVVKSWYFDQTLV
uniref:HAUS augmin like complex subunit 8 n=1 Tax=Leptobrachium leishanense TaxID=445787 RepID=A0A8C5QB45_9ANUR